MSDVTTSAPVVVRTRDELRSARPALGDGDVAVVMTMGALHEGHATLIRTARRRARHVIVTIFLNPLQFGPKEDLSRYPRTFDADMEICRKAGISQATYFNWKKKYSGMMPSEMKRLRELEEENNRLKRIVADLSLDKEMLQDIVRRKI